MKHYPSKDELASRLHYDPLTGHFNWIEGRKRGRFNGRAGFLHHTGYVVIRVYDSGFLAHRLAWKWVHGDLPDLTVDHINLDKADNRIANLRLATWAENSRNTPPKAGTLSGLKGVAWHKKSKKWQATIKDSGRCIYLGLFESPQAAQDAYWVAAKKLYGNFARLA